MIITNDNDWIKIEEDSYVWRYMSFEKLYDMISKNHLYFSRLDFFDDPLEGLKESTIFSMRYIRRLKEDGIPTTDDLINKEKKQWQQGTYASCWYLTENSSNDLNKGINNHQESFAMWNLYTTNAYSFVIKIKFGSLLTLIQQSLAEDHATSFNSASYGKIEYKPTYNPDNKEHNPPMTALVKHLSFKHENELRFLLMEARDTGKNQTGIKLKLKNNISELDPQIEIFSHPDMIKEIFKMFKKESKCLNFNLQPSNLLTKNISL